MTKMLGKFKLEIEAGSLTDSKIIVMLGKDGTGKTMFIRMMAGLIKPDDLSVEIPELNISYEP